MDIISLSIFPYGKPEALKHVDCSVDVPGNIHDQVVPAKAHEILLDIAEVIDGRILTLVLIYGRKAHCHSAAALHGRLVANMTAQGIA